MDCECIDRYDLFEELTSKFGRKVGLQESENYGCIYCYLAIKDKDSERVKEFHSYLKKNYASNYICTYVEFLKMRVTILSVCPNSHARQWFDAIENSPGTMIDKNDNSLRYATFVKC